MNRIFTLCATLLLCVAATSQAFAQGSYEVKGQVVDASGTPVIGVTVLEQNTANGVFTAPDGTYAITVAAPTSVVEFSFIGFTTMQYEAKAVPAVVTLVEETTTLNDVVVIGYGSQKKKEVTGAVASIKSEDFNAGIKTNPVGLLQGKVAGLNIIKTSSDPTNTGYSMQIRGFSTLDKGAGTSPLFIVDGVPVSSIDNIAPDEIASMDVLKDGSAAAIYGTRGTNGVIIITTKRSENFTDVAETHVEYSGYVSASMRNGNTGMATPEEFVNLEELSGGAVKPVIYEDENGNYTLTDWTKELTRKAAITHNHNVAVAGSSRKFNYRASVNYKNAEGIAKVSNREEIVAKLSASQKALKGWLQLQYDFSYMHYRNDFFCGDFKQAAIVNPTYPIYDPTTTSGYFAPQGSGQSNPVEAMNQKESYQDGNYFRGSIKATLDIKAVKGLKVSAFAAMEEGDNRSYWANRAISTDESGSGRAGRSSDKSISKLFEATIDYANSWGEHNLSAVAGFSYQNFMYDAMNISNKGFPTYDSKYYQIQNGDATKKELTVGSSRSSNTLAAFFVRANYNYDGKYLVSASVRREGSSRFGLNNKWGWFPAVSLGWRISGENFMAGQDWCNDLKLRAGFGVTGNNLASDLRSILTLSQGGTFWYNGKWVNTYGVSQDANPDLCWEKKMEYNVGLDFSFLDNRLYGSIDGYYRHTKDLLWEYAVPMPPYQFEYYLANAGAMKSYGVEFAITGVPVKTKDWTWTTTPTIAINRNFITKLSDPAKNFNYKETTSGGIGENGIMNTNTQIVVEGSPVGAFYGYKFYDIDFSKGQNWWFYTPAGGYVQAANASDGQRQVIGNAQPKFTFGWNNTVRWRNLDVSIFLRGVVGNKVLNVARWAYGPQESQAMNVFMHDVSKTKTVYANKGRFSDFYLEDGSYMKLDNITVGYTFNFDQSKYVRSLRLYLTGQNLATITKYSGLDPEVDTTSVWSSGIDDVGFYPTVATVMFGVNFNFF
ncbi:MAG: SusC/RagA family TonB-linked outer membrane protein [Alistipes sp.]|nr:SusC/RagA family TonB-linked outer membrane protein [Alistipes sp.]